MNLKINVQDGMVDIDGTAQTWDLAYGNIRGMYVSGAGQGLQLSERLEHKRDEIIDLCAKIAGLIYELQDILGEKQ